MIGGDGKVYEGRGFRHEGEHTKNANATDYNDIGIGVGFIGNFRSQEPPAVMMNVLSDFLTQSALDENLSSDYKVFFQDQLIYKDFEATELRNALQTTLGEKFYESKFIKNKNLF